MQEPIIQVPTDGAVNVGTSSTLVEAADEGRDYLLLVNDSDTTIYLARGAAAVAHSGIRLSAPGGSYEMSRALGNLYRGAIYAIHAGTGDKVLCVSGGR